MHILNLHGCDGTPLNAAFYALQAIGCTTVTSPAIDYEADPPETILDRLRKIIREERIGLLVGTSLGGFFAAVLSAELHLPVILVSPFLMPHLTFPEYIQGYIAAFGTLSSIDKKLASCIVGENDEMIGDHQFTRDLLENDRFRSIPGGRHSGASLPLQAFFAEILPDVTRILPGERRMNVSVYSREAIEKLIADGNFPENTAAITFYDPAIKRLDKDYTHVDYSSVHADVFYSELDDLDLPVLKRRGYTYETYFPEADDMAAFILRAYRDGMDLICQCEYGQSRSAGCAAAVREFFNHDGIEIFSNYAYYPNQVIYHKVYEALCRQAGLP
jgi:hypothetical protein